MKRFFVLLLTLVLLLVLAACDEPSETPSGDSHAPDATQTEGNDTANNGGDNAGATPDLDFGSILAGNGATDTIWGKQDEATKQQMIAAGKKDGVDVSFGADGSMTVVDPQTGDTVIQKPDGTWVIQGSDGSEGQFGGDWPENEFTKLLPKPDFALTGASTNEDEFAVLFQNVTIEQIRAYVEKVKAKGFTVDAELTDQEVMDMVIYSYEAQNADGYTVTVTFTGGTSGLMVSKP